MHRYLWHKVSEFMPNPNLLEKYDAEQWISLRIYLKLPKTFLSVAFLLRHPNDNYNVLQENSACLNIHPK